MFNMSPCISIYKDANNVFEIHSGLLLAAILVSWAVYLFSHISQSLCT
jgi:hypothetical protein